MNYSDYRISLDIHAIGSQAYLTAKQVDTNRRIFVSLVEGENPYAISEDCLAVFVAFKPDGNIIFNNCTIENDVICYEVTEQTLAAVGKLKCEIRLYGANNACITSPEFTLLVNPRVYSDSDIIESVTEVTTLTGLIGEANALINEVNAKLDNGDFVPKLTVGNVETLPAGSNATVEITGTGANPVLNFGIPQGAQGQAESLIPDTELSLDSTKPVQNKVITAKINDIEKDVADNTEAIKANDNKKVDKEDGKALSTNDFTNEYKEKLDGIEAGANKYVFEDDAAIAAVRIRTTDVAVATTDFVEDTTYEDFPYRAAIAIDGATEAMKPDVTFAYAEVASGIFCPVTESYAGGDTLTWDGNTEGLVSVADVFFKVSDATPTIENFSDGATITWAGAAINITQAEINDLSVMGYACLQEAEGRFMIVLEDNVDMGGMTIEKKGIYFMSVEGAFTSSLTIPGYTGFGGSGGVYIYASEVPEADITIPVIDLWR